MQKLLIVLFLFWGIKINSLAQNPTDSPFILGKSHEMFSKELSEKRIVNIYLPEGYAFNDTGKYPVIYLLDGTSNEDFVHICGIVQFFNMMYMMPPSIVVGIANVDRKRDFTFPTTIAKDKKDFPTTGGSAKFMAFLEKELQPFIEKNYKVNDSKTLIGQSLGGLLACEILAKKAHLFNRYIIVSPSLWWDNESLLQHLEPQFLPKTEVYIAVGKEGKIMEGDVRKLLKILKKQGKAKLYFAYFPKEDHATILHNAVYKAFNLFHQKVKPLG